MSCAALLSACSPQTYAVSDPAITEAGIVFDIGGKDDRSFNAAAWNGMKCAETGRLPDGTDCGKPSLGTVVRDVEPGTPVNIEPAMRAFAERKYDLIIGIGFAQAPILEAVAKDYPGHSVRHRRRRQRAAERRVAGVQGARRVVPRRHPCGHDARSRGRLDFSAAWTSA